MEHTCPHCLAKYWSQGGIEVKTKEDAELILSFISLRKSEQELILNLVSRLNDGRLRQEKVRTT